MSAQQPLTLRGSAAIVAEFFDYAVNSILYQRGIYPPEEFEQTKHYGLPLFIARDPGLRSYLDTVVGQMKEWLVSAEIKRLVLVICATDSGETMERWNFDIETDKQVAQTGSTKDQNEIVKEISALLRQITGSVSCLPLLDCPCAFDLLVYTNKDSSTPMRWEEAAPHYIPNSVEVKLRSFSTKIHKVDSLVAYKMDR